MDDETITSPNGEQLAFPDTLENRKALGTLSYRAFNMVLGVIKALRTVSETEGKPEEIKAYNAVAAGVIYLREKAEREARGQNVTTTSTPEKFS